MIIKRKLSEPRWFDLGHDVSVLIKPVTPAVFLLARQTQLEFEQAIASEMSTIVDDDGLYQISEQCRDAAFACALFSHAVIEWKGVQNEDTGEAAEFDLESIASVLVYNDVNDAFHGAVKQMMAATSHDEKKSKAA